MHSAHVSFYDRYIELLNKEIKNPAEHEVVNIKPKSISKICCSLPMYGMTHHGNDEILYIIGTNTSYRKYSHDHYVLKIATAINNNAEIKITVIKDKITQTSFIILVS